MLTLLPLACRRPADNTPRPPTPTAKYPTTVAESLPPGRLVGRVVWEGDPPPVPPVAGLIDTPDGPKWGDAANTFAPRIDADGGLADVVVSLRPVDSTRHKPWPFPPLLVEHGGQKVRAVQAGGSERVGFVRVGDEVTMVARGKGFHLLRARGAAFFSLTFPVPDEPRARKLDTPGVVEVTSAGGDFWTAVDVIVCEHPYYAVTDAAGKFELANVPTGEYELTARVRRWQITGRDRDPETGKLVRLTFAEPTVEVRKVTVGSETAEVEVRVR